MLFYVKGVCVCVCCTIIISNYAIALQLINGFTGHTVYQTEEQEPFISCCCLYEDLQTAAFGEKNGTVKVK